MSTFREAPTQVKRALLGLVVAYVLIFAIALLLTSEVALLASEGVLGAIALVFGVTIYREAKPEEIVLSTAAAFLVLGGIAQFGLVVTTTVDHPAREPLFYGASVSIVSGLAMYIFEAYVRR